MNHKQTTTAARPRGLTSPALRWPRILTTVFAVAVFGLAASAFGTSADFKTTDFAAAAPFTYNHSTGGGAYNDRTVGDFNDITEQLEGAQFTCGDVVTYLAQIEMEAAVQEAVQSANMSFSFLAESTGQSGAAHSEVVAVSINYGQVENGDNGTGTNPGAGSFGIDSGINDDGGSTVTLISAGLTGPLFQAGSELLLTVEVDDLEAGESVVLRIDTRLACDPGSSPTGNLQGKLEDVIALPSGEAAGSGAQTIPFLRVGDIAGAGEPLIQVFKTVTTADGTCGVDDVEELTVFAGETVKYCYWVSNPGTADLFDVALLDDAGTPDDESDDFLISLSGLLDLDGQNDEGDLASVATVTGEALVTFEFAQTVTNTADGIGNNGRSGGNFAELTDSDTATVIVEGLPNQPPDAINDAASTDEETPVLIGATGNDTDPDDNLDPATANTDCDDCSLPANGTLVNNGDGTFTYTPNAGFTGTDSFVYEVCDTEGLCDTATVTITVNAVNDPPVANDDSASTAEGTAVTVNASSNDTDPDGNLDPTTANTACTECSLPENGTLVNNGDGTFTYTPNDPEFSGTDSFVYEICDADGLCDTATVTITVIAQNDAPTAEDDAYSTPEDTALTIPAPGILGNDSDVDGDALSVNLLTEPSNGTLTQNADGSFTYVPDPDFNGVDSYTYEACDPSGLCDTATVTITVTGVNDPPIAGDDSATTPEETAVTIDAAANDSDADGNLDPSSATVTSGPANGTVVSNGDGTFTYTPNADFNGTDSFTYQICDTDGLCDTATVTIDVTGVNDAPVAVDDSATTSEDTTVTIPVQSNDSAGPDNEDQTLTTTEVSDPANGTATINPDGNIDYTPDENFSGTDTFTYTVCDSDGACDTATVTVTVEAVNDPPVAAADSASTPEDTAVTLDVADNDSDVDGNLDPTSTSIVSGPSNGSVTVDPDGTVTYTPDADFNGTDSFVYQICDTDGLCDTATATITVDPVNDPPAAEDDSAATPEDTAVTINAAANDSDVDGNLDPTTATVLSGPSNGTVTSNGDGTFTYTPNADFNGTDSFTYEICDTDGLCDTATVTIDVTAVNDPPVANDDQAVTDEDMSVVIDVQDNDSAGPANEDQTLTTTSVSDPANGTAVINPDGTTTYTPDPNFTGTDTFTYTVCDSDNVCDTATVTVVVNPLNDPPVANDDSATTSEDTAVLIPASSNDTDIDGNLDPTSATVLEGPSNGTVTDNGDGSFTYTPNENFNGTDSLTYEVCDDGTPDGTILCDSATVTINVTPVNDPPVAEDDSAMTPEDEPVTLALLGNDSDVDGNLDPSSVTILSGPTNGTATVNPDGTVTYTPNDDFNGTDSFVYQVCDTDGACDTATATVTVDPVNDPPVAGDDSAVTDEDTDVVIPVLDNDSAGPADEDQTLTITEVSNPVGGTVTINPDGTLTFSPDRDFNGDTSFTYTVCDSDGACDTATVNVTVNPVNDPPVAEDDAYSTAEDTELSVAAPGILENDSDVDGDALTLNVLSNPSNGTLTQNPDGSLTYTPDADFNGVDSYTYEVCDPSGACDPATVTITVTPVNDPPVAGDDSASVDEDGSVAIPVLANDSDVDGNLDPSTISIVEGPDNGTVTVNPDGTITYTPDPDFNGEDTFTYQVCDTDGACDTATVTVTVKAVNDAPVALDNAYSTAEDTTLAIDPSGILGNDSDVDGDALSVSLLTSPSNGTLTQNADGSFTYTPDPNFYGVDSYTYEACDPSGLCDEATVTITVTPVPDPPVADDDLVGTVQEDSPATISVVGNDSDPDGDLDPTTANTDCDSCSLPANGTLTNNGDGTFTYTPDPDFDGEDSFTYEVCDELGACDTATVTIDVQPVNDPPVALDDAHVTAQDTTLTVAADGENDLLHQGEDDYDVDGDAIYVDSCDATSAYGGTVTCAADGSFEYTPAAGFAGYDTFTYTICDPDGLCDTATVTIEVTAKNGRSISVSWGDWILEEPYLGGTFHITNQSGGFNVQLQGFEIVVQYRTSGPGKKEWIDVAVSGCTYDPAAPTILVDELWVTFADCELQAAIPAGATVRVTAVVGIYGHKDRGKQKQTFLSRLSKPIP